jgi:hypothetical protein
MNKPIIRQKYKIGDKVRIGNLPSSFSHFTQNGDVIILGSYSDIYDHKYDRPPEYTIMTLTGNTCAWFPERYLEFIEHVGHQGIYEAIEMGKEKDYILS